MLSFSWYASSGTQISWLFQFIQYLWVHRTSTDVVIVDFIIIINVRYSLNHINFYSTGIWRSPGDNTLHEKMMIISNKRTKKEQKKNQEFLQTKRQMECRHVYPSENCLSTSGFFFRFILYVIQTCIKKLLSDWWICQKSASGDFIIRALHNHGYYYRYCWAKSSSHFPF